MFPTKGLAARVKWEPFFVAHNPLLLIPTADKKDKYIHRLFVVDYQEQGPSEIDLWHLSDS